MDIKNFILTELKKSGVPMRMGKSEVVIRCPFHNDRNPSYHIVLEHAKFGPGVGHCFSCGASGNWNKVAEALKLKKLSKIAVAEQSPFKQYATAFDTSNAEPIVSLPKGLTEWPDESWRSFPPDFLREMEAFRWWDNINGVYRILFPIYNFAELSGYVGARLDKVTDPKYRNSKGEWARRTFFGFDYARSKYLDKVWKKYNYESVVLVEGPVDALRCWYYKIPAIAIFGTENWTKEKKGMLASLGVKNVVLFFDGDEAGREITRQVYVDLRNIYNVKRYLLPIHPDKEKQIDPGNCPKIHRDAVRELLRKMSR